MLPTVALNDHDCVLPALPPVFVFRTVFLIEESCFEEGEDEGNRAQLLVLAVVAQTFDLQCSILLTNCTEVVVLLTC